MQLLCWELGWFGSVTDPFYKGRGNHFSHSYVSHSYGALCCLIVAIQFGAKLAVRIADRIADTRAADESARARAPSRIQLQLAVVSQQMVANSQFMGLDSA